MSEPAIAMTPDLDDPLDTERMVRELDRRARQIFHAYRYHHGPQKAGEWWRAIERQEN